MKKIHRITVVLLAFAALVLAFPVKGFAETADSIGLTDKFVSAPIGDPKFDLEAMIKETATPEFIEKEYQGLYLEKPGTFSYDLSVYLVEYSVSPDFWDRVSKMDYQGITEILDPSYPTVYIPLFGEIADSSGTVSNRVIGGVQLKYNPLKDAYRSSMFFFNLPSSDYKDKKVLPFLETIGAYLTQSKTTARQVFLIRYPNSYTFGQEAIAVVQTEDDAFILDFSDSLHQQTGVWGSVEARAYTISEYRTARMEIEKDLYQTVNGWEKNPAGGNVGVQQSESQNHEVSLLPYVLIAAVLCGAVICLLVVKSRMASRKKS